MARRRTGALDDTAAHRQANTSPNSSQLPPHAEIADRAGHNCLQMLAGGGEGKLTAGELLEDADASEQSHYAEKRIGLRTHFAGESLYRDGRIVAHVVRHSKLRHARKRKGDLLASISWNMTVRAGMSVVAHLSISSAPRLLR